MKVIVHADGGSCHGTPMKAGRCPKCGIYPDSQSVELWPEGSDFNPEHDSVYTRFEQLPIFLDSIILRSDCRPSVDAAEDALKLVGLLKAQVLR